MKILKKIFGPSRKDLWQQLAHDLGGQYVNAGFGQRDYAILQVSGFDMMLETYDKSDDKSKSIYTRITAPIDNHKNVQFSISRKGALNFISKHFRRRVVELKDDDFEQNFLLQGNDEYMLTWIFDNPAMKRALYEVEKLDLQVEVTDNSYWCNEYGDPIHQLMYEIKGATKNVEQLKQVMQLMGLILEKIEEA